MTLRSPGVDYRLRWPRSLFVAEAAKLLSDRSKKDWDDRGRMLLDQAFVQGYEYGPVADFDKAVTPYDQDPWGTGSRASSVRGLSGFSAKQNFLRELMQSADSLDEPGALRRRPYYRERRSGRREAASSDYAMVVREYIARLIHGQGSILHRGVSA